MRPCINKIHNTSGIPSDIWLGCNESCYEIVCHSFSFKTLQFTVQDIAIVMLANLFSLAFTTFVLRKIVMARTAPHPKLYQVSVVSCWPIHSRNILNFQFNPNNVFNIHTGNSYEVI